MTGDAKALRGVGRFDWRLPIDAVCDAREHYVYLMRVHVALATPARPATFWWDEELRTRASSAASVRTAAVAGAERAVNFQIPEASVPMSTLIAMTRAAESLFFVELNFEPGREAAAGSVASDMAKRFAATTPAGFALEQGALLTPPGVNERAYATFQAGPVEIEITTETVARPSMIVPDLAAVPGFTLLAEAPQICCGFNGVERRFEVGGAFPPMTTLLWGCFGAEADGRKPAIMLRASAAPGDVTALEVAWRMVLGGSRPRPETG